MADRTYDIVYKCGCMESLDGGGGIMSCYSEYSNDPSAHCTYDEEHLQKEKEFEAYHGITMGEEIHLRNCNTESCEYCEEIIKRGDQNEN